MEDARDLRLRDFADFLRLLQSAGIEFVVIGGLAVGAYAALRGEIVFSGDLDLYVEEDDLENLLAWATGSGITVEKRPQARAIPVAVLRHRGQEINVLTRSAGLPAFDAAARDAREFRLEEAGLEIPVADPFDLLANKLEVRREKDEPHIAILEAFVEEEAIATFTTETNPRRRIAPARRLLRLRRARELPARLAERLIAAARELSDWRFLANHAPAELHERLLASTPAALCDEVARILASHRR